MKNLSEQMHEWLLDNGWENAGKKTGSYRSFIDDEHWLSVGIAPPKLTSPKFKGHPTTNAFGAGISHRGVAALFDTLYSPRGFTGFIGDPLVHSGGGTWYVDDDSVGHEQVATLDDVIADMNRAHDHYREYTGPEGMRRGLPEIGKPNDQLPIYKHLTLDAYEGTWTDASEQLLETLRAMVRPGSPRFAGFETGIRAHLATA